MLYTNIILKVKQFVKNASYAWKAAGYSDFAILEANVHEDLAALADIVEGNYDEATKAMARAQMRNVVRRFAKALGAAEAEGGNFHSQWSTANRDLLNKIFLGTATKDDYAKITACEQKVLAERCGYTTFTYVDEDQRNSYGQPKTYDCSIRAAFANTDKFVYLGRLCRKDVNLRKACFEWIAGNCIHNPMYDYSKYVAQTYELTLYNGENSFLSEEMEKNIKMFYGIFKKDYCRWAENQNFVSATAGEVGNGQSMDSEKIVAQKARQAVIYEPDPIAIELNALANEEIVVKDNRRSVESGNNAEKLGFRLFRLFVVKQRVVNIFNKVATKTSLKFDKENAMFSYLANFNPDLYFQIRECETLLEVIKREGLSLVSLSFSDAIEAVDRVYNDGSDCTQELRNVREMLDAARKSTNLLERVKGAFAQAKRAAASFNVNAQTLEALQMHTNVTRAQNGYCPSLYQALYQEDLDRYSDQALEKLEYIVKDTKAYNDLYDRIAAAKDTGKDSIHFVMDKVTPVVGSEVASKIFDLYKSLVEDAGVNYEDPWNLFDGNEIADGLLPAEALKAINYICIKADEDYEDYIFSSQFATDAEIEAAFQAELAAANEQIKSENARRAHLRAVRQFVLLELDNIIQSIPNPSNYVAMDFGQAKDPESEADNPFEESPF